MVNYTCDKCGNKFKQKGLYTKHLNQKTTCEIESNQNQILDKTNIKTKNNLGQYFTTHNILKENNI